MSETQPPETPVQTNETGAPGPPVEPRGERFGRGLHQARLYTWTFGLVGLLVVLIVLISVNTRRVKLSWAVGSTKASLVWIILASTVIGWLLGLVTSALFRRRTRRAIGRPPGSTAKGG